MHAAAALVCAGALLGVRAPAWHAAPRTVTRSSYLALTAITPERLRAIEAEMRARHQTDEAAMNEELFRPVDVEMTEPLGARVISGALPTDLPAGALLRNGPNPVPGRRNGGWLDGDAMVHCVALTPGGAGTGEARYSRTWLRTSGFSKEEAAGARLFDGSLVAPYGLRLLAGMARNAFRASQPVKDTANTAFVSLGNRRLLAMMEQSLPTEISVSVTGEVTTINAQSDLDGALMDRRAHPFSGGALTAHLHVDPATGEAVGVSYASAGDPSAKCAVLEPSSRRVETMSVPLLGEAQVMIHDCAITTAARGTVGGWTVLLDLPLTVRPSRMLADTFPVAYEPKHGARIGLKPRRGGPESAVWGEVSPCVVLHTCNAHESDDGSTVTLTALRVVPSTPTSFIEAYSPAFLHECISEKILSEVAAEFPALDPRAVGRPVRYGYAITPVTIGGPNRYGPPFEGILIDGVVKFEFGTGLTAGRWSAPQGWWICSEPTFVPKTDSSSVADGDDGYILVICTAAQRSAVGAAAPAEMGNVEEGDGRASRLYVIDASAMGADGAGAEVAAIALPGAVPYGLHSAWVPADEHES